MSRMCTTKTIVATMSEASTASPVPSIQTLPAASEFQTEPAAGSRKALSREKKSLIKKILRFLFSHVGLCFLNITYLSVGSVIFMQLEQYQDAEADNTTRYQILASRKIDQKRQELIDMVITRAASVNISVIEGWLDDFHALIVKEADISKYKGPITEADFTASNRWSFSSVMLFVLSLVSSIGYGHIYPKADGGYLIAVIYGLFGIPFFVMSLGSIGSGLAAALKLGYHRACCWAITKRREQNFEQRPTTSHVWAVNQVVEEPSHHERADDSVPLSLAIGTVILYAFLGGLLFSWKEQWDYIPSLYFCFVTLMTIGFGDLVPGWSITSRVTGELSIVTAFLYIVVGLALMSMTLNVAVDLLRHRVTIMISKVKIWTEEEEPDYLRL